MLGVRACLRFCMRDFTTVWTAYVLHSLPIVHSWHAIDPSEFGSGICISPFGQTHSVMLTAPRLAVVERPGPGNGNKDRITAKSRRKSLVFDSFSDRLSTRRYSSKRSHMPGQSRSALGATSLVHQQRLDLPVPVQLPQLKPTKVYECGSSNQQ